MSIKVLLFTYSFIFVSSFPVFADDKLGEGTNRDVAVDSKNTKEESTPLAIDHYECSVPSYMNSSIHKQLKKMRRSKKKALEYSDLKTESGGVFRVCHKGRGHYLTKASCRSVVNDASVTVASEDIFLDLENMAFTSEVKLPLHPGEVDSHRTKQITFSHGARLGDCLASKDNGYQISLNNKEEVDDSLKGQRTATFSSSKSQGACGRKIARAINEVISNDPVAFRSALQGSDKSTNFIFSNSINIAKDDYQSYRTTYTSCATSSPDEKLTPQSTKKKKGLLNKIFKKKKRNTQPK